MAVSVLLYETFTVPEGSVVVVTARAVGATVMESALVAACGDEAESFTCTEKKYSPAVVGCPLMAPPLERLSPGGSVPDARLQT